MTILYVVAAVALFTTVFIATWYATFFVLYAYIYGDTYGGRWQYLAWPIAIVTATSAVTVFAIRVVGQRRIRFRAWLLGAFFLLLMTLAWSCVVAVFLFPPLE